MIKLHLDEGLNDEQVLRNRKVYGDNCVDFSDFLPFKSRLISSVSHVFSIIMFALIAITFVVALKLNENDQIGQKVFAMPVACIVAAFFIVCIGIEGGFKHKGFLILTIFSVVQLGGTVYEYISSDSDITVFYYHIGLYILILSTVTLNDIFQRRRIKCQFLLNKHDDDIPYKVIRNNDICLAKRRDIVVGDLIVIHKGEIVPADCEIIESINIQVDDSAFSAAKSMNLDSEDNDNSHNHSVTDNILFRGVRIVNGYCVAKAIKVGNSVRFSKQIGTLKFKETDNSILHMKTARLAFYLNRVAFVFAILFCFVRLITFFGGGGLDEQINDKVIQASNTIIETLMIAVMVMIIADKSVVSNVCNLTIAFNLKNIIKRKFIPFSSNACYNLAATDVLCLDETNFLSNNFCKVAHASFSNISQERLAEMIAANTNAYIVHDADNKLTTLGDPIEIAMLKWLDDKDADYIELRKNVVFVDRREADSHHSLATIVKSEEIPGKHLVYVKGDPEYIMSLTDMTLAEINDYKSQLNSAWEKGWKTVAFAFGIIEEDENPFIDDILNLHNLNFAGILAFEFSPAANLKPSLSSIENSDIDVCLFTYDNKTLATSFANTLGIPMDAESADNALAKVGEERINKLKSEFFSVICLENGHNKHSIVNELKSQHSSIALYEQTVQDKKKINDKDCVLLTTDKFSENNDDVVKITESSFSTVYNAIICARSLVKNVQFFLLYYLTISAVICGGVLWSAFYLTDFPVSTTNLLWIYMLLNFVALPALTILPNTKLKCSDSFKATDKLFTKNMIFHAAFFAGAILMMLICCLFIIKYSNLHSIYNFITVNLPHHQGVNACERAILFMAVVLFMFWHLFNIRTFRDGVNTINIVSGHKFFLWPAALLLISSFSLIQFAGVFFHSISLPLSDWGWAIVLVSVVLWMNELFFFLARNKFVILSSTKRQVSLLPSRAHKLKNLLTKILRSLSKWCTYLMKYCKSAGRSIWHLFKYLFKQLCKLMIKAIDYIEKLKNK